LDLRQYSKTFSPYWGYEYSDWPQGCALGPLTPIRVKGVATKPKAVLEDP